MAKSALIPRDNEIFLDHIGLFVADLAAAPDQLRRLGFMLTPFVAHRSTLKPDAAPTPSGTGNRCAMFREGYLEMLGATGENTPLASQFHKQLARYPGAHIIAFAVADAEAHHARLTQQGFDLPALMYLERSVSAAGGGTAHFSVIGTEPAAMPEGRIQLLTHQTPELVWLPVYQGGHENGAEGLTGVLLCVEDPTEAGGRFSRFLGVSAKFSQDRVELVLDRGRVVLVTPERFSQLRPSEWLPATPYIAEYALRVANIGSTKRFLEDRSIAFERVGDGELHVPAEDALGAAILFHDAGAMAWW